MSGTVRRRLLLLFVMAALYACSGGGSGCGAGGCGGCGGCGGAPVDPNAPVYVYPDDAPQVPQGAQVHVTQRGFDFIGDNVGTLAGGLLGGGGATSCPSGGIPFCVPPTTVAVPVVGNATICGQSSDVCNDGSQGCQLEICIDPSQVDIQGRAPNEVVANIGLGLNDSLSLRIIGSTCSVNLSANPLPVSAVVQFNVGAPPAEKVAIAVPADQLVIDTGPLNIGISGGFVCSLIGAVVPLVKGLITDQLTGPITQQLDAALCTQCGADGSCPSGSTCDTGSGQCLLTGTSTCRPIDLGASGSIDLGAALASVSPGLEAGLGYTFNLANYARGTGPTEGAAPGLDLSGQVGVTAVEPSPCVPYRDPPPVDRVPASSAINANATPSGQPFAVGIGVSKEVLDLAGWGAYNSGVLCLSVGSDTIPQISTGLLATVLPSLRDLTGGADRPVSIELRPQEAPTITLGAGTTTTAADGTVSIDDPLLTLHLNNLNLDFYTFVEERYIRVFTLNTDLAVPLGLDVTPNNEISILLGDLSAALTRIEPRNGEILKTSEVANLSRLLPTLLGSLLPALTGGLLAPIAIPDVSGLRIVFGDGSFTSVDDNQMLAIFADLALAPPVTPGGLVMPLTPSIAAKRLVETPFVTRRAMLDRAERLGEPVNLDLLIPTLELDMETMVPGLDEVQLDYSWRFAGGLWSVWQQTPNLKISEPVMALEGTHNLEIRVRKRGDSSSVSPVLAATSVTIDHSVPSIEMDRVGHLVEFTATDTVSSAEAMMVRYRIADGEWTTARAAGSIDLSDYIGRSVEVSVEATDAAGHRATTTKSFRVVGGGSSSQSGQADAGCSASGNSAGSLGGMLALFAGMMMLRRRRSLSAVAGLGLAALILAACGTEPASSASVGTCDPACADGQICVDGVCQGEPDCATDADCEAGFRCEAGSCVARTNCETAADCQDGQICVDGACVAGTLCTDVSECPACEGDLAARCTDGVCACEVPCPDGCGDGTYCCNATGQCLDLPAACADTECEPGYDAVPVADGSGNSDTCEATVGQCDCVAKPPLPIGNFGTWTDSGVSPDGSQFVVATFNATYGDLMVGVVGTGDEVAWEFVDGVPSDAAVTGDPNGPRGGIAATGAIVGRYASVEVANDGVIHVSYYAQTGDSLRSLIYARGVPSPKGHDWTRIVVDPNNGAGLYTDLVIDAAGNPGIAYLAPTISDTAAVPATYASELRFAAATTSTPGTAADFTIHALDRSTNDLSCGGGCATAEACRIDTNLCTATAADADCGGACTATQKCFASDAGPACAEVATFPKFNLFAFGAGLFADAEYFSSGELGVAYYDSIHGNLKYLRVPTDTYTGTPVIVAGETVDATGAAVDTGDVGRFPDLFIGTGDETFVSYYDATRNDLRLANLSASTDELLDDGLRDFAGESQSSRVGLDSSLVFLGSQLSVVYQDATEHTIVEKIRGDSGWSAPATVIGGNRGASYEGAYGFYLGQAIPTSGRALLSYKINAQVNPVVRTLAIVRR